MNKIVRLLLFLFVTFVTYFTLRLTRTSNFNLINQVTLLSLSLILSLFTIYKSFSILKSNPKTGPTIIKASKLKTILYIITGFWWIAFITWMLSDIIKTFQVISFFPFYSLVNFIDETIGHVFMYLSIISLFLSGVLLEIERPFVKSVSSLETVTIIIVSIITGTMWGLNLTEGRLSQFTSLPVMVIFFILTVYLFKKHKLKFINRPWSLSSAIFYITSSISFSIWGIAFNSFPEFFNYLK